MYIYLLSNVRILHGIFLAKHIILNVSSSVLLMQRTCQITIVLVTFTVLFNVAWLTVPAYYGSTVFFAVSLFVAWLIIQALYGATVIFVVHCL